MTVTVTDNKTGQAFTGKFASVGKDQVGLFSGCMSDKKGGFRGCGKKTVFAADSVTVKADDPAKETKQA
ncbi:MAG: hypothetical protein HY671_08695 [Chloroflexi bacterium]|nr:hypothetical protein [Chloroflexota bacterium]